MNKTNVCRLLDESGISYSCIEYDSSITNGEGIAKTLGEDPDHVFKTLVTESDKREHFVFVIPVNYELSLKKAAKAVGVKSISMIKQKELLPLTGYIHGGCSPIGMKRKFITILNDTAELFDYIYVSAGRVGVQIKINPNDLRRYIGSSFVDVI